MFTEVTGRHWREYMALRAGARRGRHNRDVVYPVRTCQIERMWRVASVQPRRLSQYTPEQVTEAVAGLLRAAVVVAGVGDGVADSDGDTLPR